MQNPFQVILDKLEKIEMQLESMKAKAAEKEAFSEYPELLTREQAADILNVKLPTLDLWAKQNNVQKLRNGKIVRFQKSDILNLLKINVKYQRN